MSPESISPGVFGARPIRVGARRSPLAVAQAKWVAARLQANGARTEIVGIDTRGDTDRRHLTEIGGTGVFAVAVRDGLHAGEIDVAVHSMKDLPTAPAPGLVVAAVPGREDTRDVLIGCRLSDLRDGMVIGTGSPRRQLQLAAYAEAAGLRISFQPIRGNVDRRLGLVRSGEVDATVLAAAGLRRLDRMSDLDLAHELLEPEVMLPAAAQGALAVEIAEVASPGVHEAVAALDDPIARARTTAEREFLRVLEAGCLAPVGVLAEVGLLTGNGPDLTLRANVGKTLLSNLTEPTVTGQLDRFEGAGAMGQAADVGRRMALVALARSEAE